MAFKQTTNTYRFLVGVSIAVSCALALPLLSGSNHTCPVLRQQDQEKGPGAHAVPAFARKYNVDCTYCHTAWPQLNRTGIIFRYLGYRMPYEVPTLPKESNKKPGTTTTTPGANNQVPLRPPITAGHGTTAGAIAEGKKVFSDMQCSTCHINGGNVIVPSKPIKGAEFLKKFPEDQQIANVIRQGVPGTAMPGFDKDRLSDDQLTTLVAYIRSLTPQQP